MKTIKKDVSLIAAGFATGSIAYKLVQKAIDPTIEKKAIAYGKQVEEYYNSLIKKGMDPDAANAETIKKYPQPLWKKLGSNRIEAMALLGISTALTLSKNSKIDNLAKGMMVFAAIKTILPTQKIFIESFTDKLTDRL